VKEHVGDCQCLGVNELCLILFLFWKKCDMMCWNQRYFQKSRLKKWEEEMGIWLSPMWWGEKGSKRRKAKSSCGRAKKASLDLICQMLPNIVIAQLFMEPSSINEVWKAEKKNTTKTSKVKKNSFQSIICKKIKPLKRGVV
jgi:hypothetical protein